LVFRWRVPVPPTRLALGQLASARARRERAIQSRNLGGAIGLALVDTVLYGRAPVHAAG